jgi:hypothetical protein
MAYKQQTRFLVNERAKGCCEYCMSQEKYASQAFSIEHIHPEALGGSHDLENLALACQGCNNYKYTKVKAIDPESGQIVDLFNPRQDLWVEHFSWNENFTVIIGISSKGRATVSTLRMNRDFLINQRILFRQHNIHPPEHSLL